MLLGGLALRAPGRRLEWDSTKQQVKNVPELNALVRPDYRKGWSLLTDPTACGKWWCLHLVEQALRDAMRRALLSEISMALAGRRDSAGV